MKITIFLTVLFLLTGCLQKGSAPSGESGIPQDITISLLTVTPPLAVAGLNQKLTFSALGGKAPYVFQVQSGFGVVSTTGEFSAPAFPGTTTLKVTDSQNNTAFSVVTTSSSLLVSPLQATVGTGRTYQFTSGGGAAPYSYSLASGTGSIDAATGLYTAPVIPGVAVVRVLDGFGNFAQANVQIVSALTLTPDAQTVEDLSVTILSASGGMPPYTYSIYAGAGSINSSTGAFTAGAIPENVILRVKDANEQIDEATLTVALRPIITSALQMISTNETLQLSVTQGTVPYTFSIVSGPGSVASTGILSTGSLSGTSVVQVTDANGFSSSVSVSIFTPTKISIGESFICWVRENVSGTTSDSKCLGRNNYAQRGDNSLTIGDGPAEMGDALAPVNLGPNILGKRIFGAYTGRYCVVLSDNRMKCFGDNSNGRLGINGGGSRGYQAGSMGAALPFVNLGTNTFIQAPVHARSVAMGAYHTCAIVTGGQLKCWGHNSHGQLGLGDTWDRCTDPSNCGNNLPAVNLGGETALQVVAGERHTCVLLSPSERVKCWGMNSLGQLGTGNNLRKGDTGLSTPDYLSHISLGDVSMVELRVKKITAGWLHTCALLENDQVKCWGQADYGAVGSYGLGHLGNDAGEMGNALPYVSLSTTKTIKNITSKIYHTCAVFTDNTLKCWGYNEHGELGIGSLNHQGDEAGEMGDNLPFVNIGATESVSEVETDYNSTCVLTMSGKAKCWGRNNEGTLGLGDQSVVELCSHKWVTIFPF